MQLNISKINEYQRTLERPSPVTIHINQLDPVVQFNLPSLQQYFQNTSMPNQDYGYFEFKRFEFPPYTNSADSADVLQKSEPVTLTMQLDFNVTKTKNLNTVDDNDEFIEDLIARHGVLAWTKRTDRTQRVAYIDLANMNTPEDFAVYMRNLFASDALYHSYPSDFIESASDPQWWLVFYAWFRDFAYDPSTGKYVMRLQVPDDRRYIYAPYPNYYSINGTPNNIESDQEYIANCQLTLKWEFDVGTAPEVVRRLKSLIGATDSASDDRSVWITYDFDGHYVPHSGALRQRPPRTNLMQALAMIKHGRFLHQPYEVEPGTTQNENSLLLPREFAYLSIYQQDFSVTARSSLAAAIGDDHYIYVRGTPFPNVLGPDGRQLNFAFALPPNKSSDQTAGTGTDKSQILTTQKVKCPLQALRNFKLELTNSDGSLCKFSRPFLLEIGISFDL